MMPFLSRRLPALLLCCGLLPALPLSAAPSQFTLTVTGTVTALSDHSLSLNVMNGPAIQIGEHTRFTRACHRVAAGDVYVGDTATVTMSVQTDNSFLALSVAASPCMVLADVLTAIDGNDITVGGSMAHLGPRTLIAAACMAASPAALKVGDAVAVRGSPRDDGSVAAELVVDGSCTVAGPLEEIGVDSIVVAGRRLALDDATFVAEGCAPGVLADLNNGSAVSVQVLARANGTPLALAVATGPCIFNGAVAAKSGSHLAVAGRTVTVNAGTRYRLDGAVMQLADVQVGDHVAISGVLQADGSALAATLDNGAIAFGDFAATVEADMEMGGLEAQGTFTLGPASNGINPATETVRLEIGDFRADFAVGSFKAARNGKSWTASSMMMMSMGRNMMMGSRMGTQFSIQSLGHGAYGFSIIVANVNLAGMDGLVPVRLRIGDDAGETASQLFD